jgi:hypothetical protein
MDADNVDRSLVELFEASREHQRARRELLPPEWLNAERDPADHLAKAFEEVVARAYEHVRSRREAVRPGERSAQSQA